MGRTGFRLGSRTDDGQGTLVSFLPDLPLLTSQVHCGTCRYIHQGLEVHEQVLVPRTGTATLTGQGQVLEGIRVKDTEHSLILVKPVYGNFSRYWLL